MSTFKERPELFHQVDYRIIANGWLQLYHTNGRLGKDLDWLNKAGYEIAEFTCHGTTNLLNQFNDYFHFPAYFSHNLDALNDCLRDIEIKGMGLVITLKHVDNLKKDKAEALLDILANMARLNFIVGKRVLILAQIDDENFHIENIGFIKILWKI